MRRWHVWLGWVIALPILFWVLSGLIMVWKPIEEVRGTHLLRDPGAVRLSGPPVAPRIVGAPIASLSLEPRAAGARWIVKLADGTIRQADPATGALLPGLSAADAVREVKARYAGSAGVASVSRTDPAKPPLELRREIPAWQVTLDDGTHFFVDSRSGQVVATRTGWWRFYDFMFGLHIMDLKTREDTHNPLVITFAVVALLMSILAMVLLPMTINRRKRRPIRQ
ncbi:MAG TPA: PepSY domain-containing protein, partial [Sphingomicrobium sp.]|nr:PepSY domain-containing protein [Sphingomicrobium sp.]